MPATHAAPSSSPPSSVPLPPRWQRLLDFWPVGLTLLLSLAVCLGLAQLLQQEQLRRTQIEVDAQLGLMRARLEATAQGSFNLTQALDHLIQLDGDISPSRFTALASRVLKLLPQVRNFTAAPDDVVRHVYPLAGNERVMGLDYRQVPVQYARVQAARAAGQAIIDAPVKLVQGGLGVIQRTPVFLPPASPGEAPRYWGTVSVVADLERFMHAAGLDQQRGLRLAIYEEDGRGGIGRLIWGDEALAAQAHQRQQAQLPGARWLLLAMPSGGWAGDSVWQHPTLLASAAAGLALSLISLLLVQRRGLLLDRNSQLAAEVARAEQAQQRFQSLAELGSDWIWEQDEELRFTYISRLAEQASNVRSKHVLGLRRWESPATIEGMDWEAHKAQLARREPFKDLEYAQLAMDGSRRYLSISGVPVYDADGRFRGYRGTGRDITATRRAEAALRESEAALTQARDRLQAVLDAALEVAIIATDCEGRISLFNRGAERMLGWSEAELLGQTPERLHLAEELQQRAAELSQALGRPVAGFDTFVAQARRDGSETRNWTYLRRDGSRLTVSLMVTSVHAKDAQLIGYLGIARDISEQRRAEQALVALNAELEQRVAKRGAELRLAQEELMRSERMAALGALVAGVAHELNTPLGNCMTTASTLDERSRELRRQFEDGSLRRSTLTAWLDEVQQASSLLLRSIHSANELVQHFKQVSVDRSSEQRRSFALAQLLADELSVLRPRWRSTPWQLQLQTIDPALVLDSYPGALGQVISNLVLNALAHAFEGRSEGRLTISAAADPAQPGWLTLSFEDDGIGMSEAVRRRAFDPFFTTKMGRGGSGLGLHIVYNIVTGLLGGSLSLESQAGKGSRFVCRLPQVAPQAPTAAAPGTAA